MKTTRMQFELDPRFETREQFKARVYERGLHLGMLTAAIGLMVTFVACVALLAFGTQDWMAVTGWFVAGVIASAGLAWIISHAYYTIVAWRDL